MSINSHNAQSIRIKGLVQNLRATGIQVPKEITEEVKLLDSYRILSDKRQASKRTAIDELNGVDVKDFENALHSAFDTWTAHTPEDEFLAQVDQVIYQRLVGALLTHQHTIIEDVANKINLVVGEYRLNDVRLPHDLATFDIMRASQSDLEAIAAFKNAVPLLNKLWSCLKSLVTSLGYDFSGKEFSSALDVAFLISNVDDFRRAEVLAEEIGLLGQRVDSQKNIKDLGIWGLVNLAGHDIEMKSIHTATEIRANVQFPQAPVKNTPVHRAAGFML